MAKVIRDLRNRDKNVQTDSIEAFLVKCHGEIRKVTEVEELFDNDIKSNYIELLCEDDELNRFTLKDKNLKNTYKVGTFGTFTLQIYIEHKFKGKTKINLVEFFADK